MFFELGLILISVNLSSSYGTRTNANRYGYGDSSFRGTKAAVRSTPDNRGLLGQSVNPYRHKLTLDSRGKYILEWEVDWENERVHFNATVATNGFVGFGLSKKAKMAGADLVIGGVINGKPYFSDRHAIGNQLPVIDESQDWTLHEAWERGTLTFLSFSRPFDTCDTQGDLVLDGNLLSIIWAYGENDDEVQYHFENRGTYNIYLLDPDVTPPSLFDKSQSQIQSRQPLSTLTGNGFPYPNTNVFRLNDSITLPQRDTLYSCSFHRAPTSTKHHIIGFDINFPSERDRRMVHHLLLYRCQVPAGSPSFQMLEEASQMEISECYPNIGIGEPAVRLCREVVHGFGIGGRSLFFPENVGIPLSENGPEYFMMQTHYDNPNLLSNANVSFSLDAYYTSNLRENDASCLFVGGIIPGATNIVISPSSLGHVINGHCASGCTQRMFPPEGINVFAVYQHTHLSGREVRLRQFRGRRELPWVLSDDNYNFNFQEGRLLRRERKIMPGDQLVMRCVYDSTQRNGTVVSGGYSTREEMCLAFLYYYKKIPGIISCLGDIRDEEYHNLLGIRNTTFDLNLRETVITNPTQFSELTVSNYATNYLDWDIRFRNEIQERHLFAPQISSCPIFSSSNNNTGGILNVGMANQEESISIRDFVEYKPPPSSQCGLRRG